MLLSEAYTNRWAPTDQSVSIKTSAQSVTACVGDASVEAPVQDGIATLDQALVNKLIPEVGVFEIVWTGGGATVLTTLERVGSRYCTKEDLIEYGKRNNDGFDDTDKYSDAAFAAAIQAAEEAIEAGCKKSFCTRAIDVYLKPGVLNELPVVAAQNISDGVLVSDRQARTQNACIARVVYGERLFARIKEATMRLAASYLRPSAIAENARAQSQDGLYMSFTLATGEEGSWTGIPYVDAVIEEYRAVRLVII